MTGAGRGLGKGLALRLAIEGCKVAVADINRVNADQTAAEIIKSGGVAKVSDITYEGLTKVSYILRVDGKAWICILVLNDNPSSFVGGSLLVIKNKLFT